MLMSVSAATSKWIKIAEGSQPEQSDAISDVSRLYFLNDVSNLQTTHECVRKQRLPCEL